MALTLEQETRVGAPADAVWMLLTDPRAWPRWWPAVGEARTTDHRTLKEGSKVLATLVFGPVRLGHTGAITLAVQPKSLSWDGQTLGLASRHEWYMGDRSGATTVKHRVVFHGISSLLLRVPVLRRGLEKTMRSGLTGLKRTAEQLF